MLCCAVLCLVSQSCPTLCDPMDCSPPGSSVHGDSLGKNTGVGLPCPPPGDLPNPGIKPRSPALQVSEPPGKLKNTGVGSLSLPQGIFPTQKSNQGLPHCQQILYQLSYRGRPEDSLTRSKMWEFYRINNGFFPNPSETANGKIREDIGTKYNLWILFEFWFKQSHSEKVVLR